jgi:hypothetical protein
MNFANSVNRAADLGYSGMAVGTLKDAFGNIGGQDQGGSKWAAVQANGGDAFAGAPVDKIPQSAMGQLGQVQQAAQGAGGGIAADAFNPMLEELKRRRLMGGGY